MHVSFYARIEATGKYKELKNYVRLFQPWLASCIMSNPIKFYVFCICLHIVNGHANFVIAIPLTTSYYN